MTTPGQYRDLPGFGVFYSETELRVAVAIAEAFIENSLGGGGGGGGGGDATAANQLTQITRLEEIRDRLALSGTINRYLGNTNTANLKASAGTIYSFTCSNFNSAIRYFQIFNKASAAVNTDVPVISYPVLPNDGLTVIGEEILGAAGLTLTTGVTWAFSSTRLTCTLATATDCTAIVRWG